MVQRDNMFVEISYVNNENINYIEAIELGVNQLIKANKAKIGLRDAILDSMQKNGPYFVLSPKLALAHAAPGDYCLEPALSLIVFSKPISFSENEKHDVQVLVTLSAPNANSHMDLIVWFSQKFGNGEVVKKLCCAKNVDEITKILGGK